MEVEVLSSWKPDGANPPASHQGEDPVVQHPLPVLHTASTGGSALGRGEHAGRRLPW